MADNGYDEDGRWWKDGIEEIVDYVIVPVELATDIEKVLDED